MKWGNSDKIGSYEGEKNEKRHFLQRDTQKVRRKEKQKIKHSMNALELTF